MNAATDYYRRLPYTRKARPVEDDGGAYWLAWVDEIPWIQMHGQTREEAHKLLLEVFEDCIGAMLDNGDDVPEPVPWPERW